MLEFNKSKIFTLAIFSDLHYGEEEHGWGIDQDIKSTRVMNSVLDSEHSIDLVVLNGDLITGENTFRENSSEYLDQIVAPLVHRSIPWASTYGNHDSKFNLSRESLYQAEKRYPLSYTRKMNASLPGITNYYLLIRAPDGLPAAILWFFDSRGGASYQRDPSNQDDIPNWVADETAAWYKASRTRLQSQYGLLPSIAFVHIPPHPFLAAQEAGLDPGRFPGINDDVPLAIQGEGHNDDAFVEALLEDNLLNSIHVGHDHGDSWCATWPKPSLSGRGSGHLLDDRAGPILCFSRHTGYGGYGTWDRGARIVQLSLQYMEDAGASNGLGKMHVGTWVRMENREVITRVTLNETYGSDIYYD
ncbi:hypothetical protein N0V82_000988 [Gnomoniopsis sp. IMI 355080]|nr:hypothetical protein N0V82_000988 [Gnomoniopsis sp. IMI 355080]